MKNTFLSIVAVVMLAAIFASCGHSKKADLKTKNDSVAYSIGIDVGSNIKDFKKRMESDSVTLNADLFIQGFKDALNDVDSLTLPKELKQKVLMNFQREMQQKQQEKLVAAAGPAKNAGKKFLEANKKQPGVIETPSGLQYKVIKEGKGKNPTATDSVVVNYEGKFIDDTIFDSSYKRKKPATLALNRVIQGWTEGIQLMKEGSIYEFYIPSDLAYGDMGDPQRGMPGGSTLKFKVELIKVKAPAGDDQNKTADKKKKQPK
jgi:FKBP-type peptidyl-prolyl cis-trans isomerase